MRFSELKVCMAITTADLGGRDLHTDSEKNQMMVAVFTAYIELFDGGVFDFSRDDVYRLYLAVRKNEATKIKTNIALWHGVKCFWVGRGKGACCDNAEAGHLIPKSKSGDLSVENCVIECRSHNNQRRAMLVEEYLGSNRTTG